MKKHSVNGYMFCQQPPVVAVQGQDVRVILIGIGGETDMHTPIFTDSVLVSPDATAYTRTLLPGSVRVVQLTTGARFPMAGGRLLCMLRTKAFMKAETKGAATAAVLRNLVVGMCGTS